MRSCLQQPCGAPVRGNGGDPRWSSIDAEDISPRFCPPGRIGALVSAGDDEEGEEHEPAVRSCREIEPTDHAAGQGSEWINRRATEQATRAANARQLSGRRRFVDPTTCEREYSEAEMEFMMAMNEYKRRSGRMFPTWSEVLEVLQGWATRRSRSQRAAIAESGAAAARGS